eukprot:1164772-Pleurochrysis_carterae.AAC.1
MRAREGGSGTKQAASASCPSQAPPPPAHDAVDVCDSEVSQSISFLTGRSGTGSGRVRQPAVHEAPHQPSQAKVR